MAGCSHLDHIQITELPESVDGCATVPGAAAASGCTCACAWSAARSAAATTRPGSHASEHAHATGHPIIRSIEPGEDVVVVLPRRARDADPRRSRARRGSRPRRCCPGCEPPDLRRDSGRAKRQPTATRVTPPPAPCDDQVHADPRRVRRRPPRRRGDRAAAPRAAADRARGHGADARHAGAGTAGRRGPAGRAPRASAAWTAAPGRARSRLAAARRLARGADVVYLNGTVCGRLLPALAGRRTVLHVHDIVDAYRALARRDVVLADCGGGRALDGLAAHVVHCPVELDPPEVPAPWPADGDGPRRVRRADRAPQGAARPRRGRAGDPRGRAGRAVVLVGDDPYDAPRIHRPGA